MRLVLKEKLIVDVGDAVGDAEVDNDGLIEEDIVAVADAVNDPLRVELVVLDTDGVELDDALVLIVNDVDVLRDCVTEKLLDTVGVVLRDQSIVAVASVPVE